MRRAVARLRPVRAATSLSVSKGASAPKVLITERPRASDCTYSSAAGRGGRGAGAFGGRHGSTPPGVVYWEPAGYRPLTLDLYLPGETVEPPPDGFPLVVFVHGGGWMGGDARRSGAFADFPGVLASLAARGYVVASVEYRLSGEATFPAAIQDVKAAIRRLRSDAAKYGIDPALAMTWGVSAGGPLPALPAGSCNGARLGAAAAPRGRRGSR